MPFWITATLPVICALCTFSFADDPCLSANNRKEVQQKDKNMKPQLPAPKKANYHKQNHGGIKMKVTIILLVLLMAAPCFARSKKSQARLDKRHAAVEAAAKANLMNAKADAITQRSRDSHKRNEQRLIYNQQIINQRAHQTAIRNGQQYRKQKAANSRKYTGF